MKIIFIGTVKFSDIILKHLVYLKATPMHVFTKKTSHYNTDFVDLGKTCKKFNIMHSYVTSINSKENIQLIRGIKPDVIFCFGWSELLSQELLNIPRFGVVGYHPTLLPQNRGRHPLIWALALGLRDTGSTFFLMDARADSGDILSQRKVRISYRDDAKSLYSKISCIASRQLKELLPRIINRDIRGVKQDRSIATYWRKRTVCDGLIDWRMSSRAIYNLVRALARPYPGAHFEHKGVKINVWQAQEIKRASCFGIEPGKVLETYSKKKFLIKTGDNCILVRTSNSLFIHKGDYL